VTTFRNQKGTKKLVKQWLNTLGLGADDVSREMTYIIALINGDKTLSTCYYKKL